jgi:ABC-type multidrug transport system ATPase subunit
MFIECKDLTYKYPGTDTYIFNNLSCRISGPGFHSLFGPSGVGKTTLARVMTEQVTGFSGSIVTHDIGRILYCYNVERLPGWYSVGDHLEEVTPTAYKDRADRIVGFFRLEACLASRFAQLSLGQQNRVNLARYLLQDFDALIMDESLANVDEPTRQHIILEIKEMFPTKSFIYISHNVLEVSKFCDQILVLRSTHKSPQAVPVVGRDYRKDAPLENRDLELTMLEVLHAA